MSNHEFYVGWQDEMPKGNKHFLNRVVLIIFVLIPVFIFITVTNQQGFNDHQFEFGTLSQLTGTLRLEPVPILQVENGIPEGFSNDVLLVGLGKFGAEGILQQIEEEEAVTLTNRTVTLEGTLIYGDGVTVFELTNQEASFISVTGDAILDSSDMAPMSSSAGIGEIVDPKCYFGVMKPGEGKIHKSCAIRCLSGGIPAVLKVKSNYGNKVDYFLIRGEDGEEIAQELLPYIGKMIEYRGDVYTKNGWNIIQLNKSAIETYLTSNDKLYTDRSTVASLMSDHSESGENFCTYAGR